MKKPFYVNLSFQIMIIITFGLLLTAGIQYVYSHKIIQQSIFDGTKKQAYTSLQGIERQIQSLKDPFNEKELKHIFHNAFSHDIDNLDFTIINLYMYDKSGEVVAFLHEPEILFKDLDSKYGEIFRSQQPYFGNEIEDHHSNSQGQQIKSTDILTPVHFNGRVIGGLEIEIDLNKTFGRIQQMDDRYDFQISFMLLAMILFLLFFIRIILNRLMVIPIRKISNVTEKIAKGDLEARVELNSSNEIGILANSVNTMALKLEKLFTELDEIYLGTLNSLTKALEAKDDYTANHSANVTRYALDLGLYLGLRAEELKILKQGAMLHDLGKIGIPDDVLKKDDELNKLERDIIQQHPPLTSAILDPLEKFKHFSDIARYHHERWDGKGYPDGLTGENIPFLARIVSITDSWDAMTSDRVYRKGMEKEQALQILEQERDNGQWDPCLVDQFVILLRENSQYDLPPVDIAA